jgi:hypothetical protein
MSIQSGETTIASAPSVTASAGFRDSGTLTRWLVILLWANVALAVIAAVSGVFEVKLLTDIQAGLTLAPGQAEANDLRQQVIAVVHMIQLITLIVVFCIWIHRANYNARQLGAADMKFTPGWAIGWYFIPIMNLWKPYQAMKEIWKASANPTHWQDTPRGSILPLWWTFFLISNFLGNASLRLSLRANTLPELITAGSISIANDVVDIIASLLALTLVRQIHRMQMSHRMSAAFR